METQTAPSNFVLVCNKINSTQQEQMNRVELANFNCTVSDLATTIGQQLNLDKDTFDIISFGQTLGSAKTLESYGINSKGTIVYLMKKKEAIFKEPQPPQAQETEAAFPTQVQEGCVAVKSALINAHFRKVLDGLADIEKRENLMAINPELRDDPTLFGILTDDTLVNTFIKPTNIMKVLKKYPNFLEVATHVAATFHEESSSSNPFNLDNLGRGALLNYSLDYPSDDEMDDSETSSVDSNSTQASGSGSGGGGGRLAGHPTQGFQNLLNAAHQFQQIQRQNVRSGAAATQQPSRQLPTIITPEMLSLALSSATSAPPSATPSPAAATVVQQQPQQQQQTGQPAPAPAPVSQPPSSASRIIGWAPQLRQMRELGITDDIVAIQALEATNGDVQAAINIIFS
ncbi:PREDICTED: ubiquitin-like protein 7 [Rhagoletis zephyria]|uniref:ubiquitin-like protein 7 n=1 Tax=Rhagoletis zephyria TaxID=28612 RepID=UPI00081149C0|nr:PREDICTED: ubiquitin-like protein 7 [Rhagoletis zephyria]KAH9410428.1 Ubiquitin-like protein 7 [Tyrophagus putrescentiae]